MTWSTPIRMSLVDTRRLRLRATLGSCSFKNARNVFLPKGNEALELVAQQLVVTLIPPPRVPTGAGKLHGVREAAADVGIMFSTRGPLTRRRSSWVQDTAIRARTD